MSHWPILPFVVPFAAAILLLLAGGLGLAVTRALSLASMALLAAVAIALVPLADDSVVRVYRLGNWPAPYGIVLVLDRLSAIMAALTAVLALPALLQAMDGTDTRGRHFHALFHFQLAGLMGAFLTGDVFNLFVFFEILLLASYVLLLHGSGLARSRAGIAYVAINLSGSALFLIALALIYGTLGTLNLADIASVLPGVPAVDQALVRTSFALLAAVFVLKAALVPIGFWLPHVYGAATVPVAALFAVMTKVGIYALLRIAAIAFPAAPFTADLLVPWLVPLAVLTIAVGVLGALAARRLSLIAANLVLISTGTLLPAVVAGTASATAAALYYLPHTTLAAAGMFLIAGHLARERGELADTVAKGPVLRRASALGAAYLVLALAVSGMPPLSGFLGKLMIMQAVAATTTAPVVWAALLLSSLAAALVLARAASAFFWEPGRGTATAAAPRPGIATGLHPGLAGGTALLLLAAASPLLTLTAAPAARYAQSAAEQLHAREPYIRSVLGDRPAIERERRP